MDNPYIVPINPDSISAYEIVERWIRDYPGEIIVTQDARMSLRQYISNALHNKGLEYKKK